MFRPPHRRPVIDDKGSALRVVHVIDSLGSGGAEHNLVNLLRASDCSTFEHHVVGLYREDTLADLLRQAGIALTMLRGGGPRTALGLLPSLTSLISRLDPQLVHTQLVMSDLLGRAAVLLSARRPMLSTLQNRPYDREACGVEIPNRALARAIRGTDRWLGTRTCTRYIAVSEAVRSSYVRELGIAPERIEVIYNSVDLAKYRSAGMSPAERSSRRRALGLREAPLLLNVARHAPQKGLLDIVAAMDEPLVRASGAQLLLVGAGPETLAIRGRIGALRLDTSIQLLGRRSDVAELMTLSDVFVLPSIYEGLPLVLLEALATGLPVVASDLAEIREVTTERGAQLVPPGQPKALAEAIARLIASPEVGRAAALEGRRQVERRFDLRQNVPHFEAALRRAASADLASGGSCP